MASADLHTWLGRTVLFDGLGADDLGRLAGISRESSLKANAALFDQGDESDGLYLIVTGIIRIY